MQKKTNPLVRLIQSLKKGDSSELDEIAKLLADSILKTCKFCMGKGHEEKKCKTKAYIRGAGIKFNYLTLENHFKTIAQYNQIRTTDQSEVSEYDEIDSYSDTLLK